MDRLPHNDASGVALPGDAPVDLTPARTAIHEQPGAARVARAVVVQHERKHKHEYWRGRGDASRRQIRLGTLFTPSISGFQFSALWFVSFPFLSPRFPVVRAEVRAGGDGHGP